MPKGACRVLPTYASATACPASCGASLRVLNVSLAQEVTGERITNSISSTRHGGTSCSKVVGALVVTLAVQTRRPHGERSSSEFSRRSRGSKRKGSHSVSCAALVPVIMARVPSPASTRFLGTMCFTSLLLLAAFMGGIGLATAGGELRKALRTKTEKTLRDEIPGWPTSR